MEYAVRHDLGDIIGLPGVIEEGFAHDGEVCRVQTFVHQIGIVTKMQKKTVPAVMVTIA